MWNVRVGLDWDTIAGSARPWANANEVALARHFVTRLKAARGDLKGATRASLYVEVGSQDDAHEAWSPSFAAC